MIIKKKKNSSAENKNYNIVNRAVQTDTGANLKTFILEKKRLSVFEKRDKMRNKIKRFRQRKKTSYRYKALEILAILWDFTANPASMSFFSSFARMVSVFAPKMTAKSLVPPRRTVLTIL